MNFFQSVDRCLQCFRRLVYVILCCLNILINTVRICKRFREYCPGFFCVVCAVVSLSLFNQGLKSLSVHICRRFRFCCHKCCHCFIQKSCCLVNCCLVCVLIRCHNFCIFKSSCEIRPGICRIICFHTFLCFIDCRVQSVFNNRFFFSACSSSIYFPLNNTYTACRIVVI